WAWRESIGVHISLRGLAGFVRDGYLFFCLGTASLAERGNAGLGAYCVSPRLGAPFNWRGPTLIRRGLAPDTLQSSISHNQRRKRKPGRVPGFLLPLLFPVSSSRESHRPKKWKTGATRWHQRR